MQENLQITIHLQDPYGTLLVTCTFYVKEQNKATFTRAGAGGKAALYLAPIYCRISGAIQPLAGRF